MEDDLKKLLEENLEISKENHKMLKSIKRHFIWQKIISLIYLILIVGPIIWSIIYLPKILQPMISQYQSLLSLPGEGKIDLKNIDINSLMKSLNQQNLENKK